MIRLLVVRNTAGMLTPVADWLESHGHAARMIETEANDPYNMTGRSPTARILKKHRELYYALYEEIKDFKPTHIHVNRSHHALALARLFCPLTPIVFMYHGSDVRDRCITGGLPEYWEIALSDKVIVSTNDLGEYGAVYDRIIPEFFYDRGGRVKGTALMQYANFFASDQREEAKEISRVLGLELTIVDRRAVDFVPTPYDEMPFTYSKYEYYLDFKGSDALSKAALEALHCGCKVVHMDSKGIPRRPTLQDLKGMATHTTVHDYLKMYKQLPRPSLLSAIKRFPRLVASTHKRLALAVAILLRTKLRRR